MFQPLSKNGNHGDRAQGDGNIRVIMRAPYPCFPETPPESRSSGQRLEGLLEGATSHSHPLQGGDCKCSNKSLNREQGMRLQTLWPSQLLVFFLSYASSSAHITD